MISLTFRERPSSSKKDDGAACCAALSVWTLRILPCSQGQSPLAVAAYDPVLPTTCGCSNRRVRHTTNSSSLNEGFRPDHAPGNLSVPTVRPGGQHAGAVAWPPSGLQSIHHDRKGRYAGRSRHCRMRDLPVDPASGSTAHRRPHSRNCPGSAIANRKAISTRWSRRCSLFARRRARRSAPDRSSSHCCRG